MFSTNAHSRVNETNVSNFSRKGTTTMSTSEDQPAGKPTPKNAGGSLQSKDVGTDTEGKDKRNESQQAPAMEAADQSRQ
jgi:hypothetical protein